MAQTVSATGTVVGYFEDHNQAARAVEALQESGFTSAHLGVAYRGGAQAGGETGVPAGVDRTPTTHISDDQTGVWGKIRNFFGADESEPYADERTDGGLATREITADPTSGYAADGNDFHHNLRGLDVPEDRSRYFGHRFESTEQGAVVTVNAGSRVSEAEVILKRYGADLGENYADYDYPDAPSAATAANSGRDADLEQNTPQNIQLLGEVLRVHKDRVSRGEVRLRKEVVTEMQTVQVPVTHEELVIERRPADGQAVQGTIGASEEIRIPLSEEQASVDKSTVVREEVSVGKKQVQETRDLSSDVRHEELQVEDTTRNMAGTNQK